MAEQNRPSHSTAGPDILRRLLAAENPDVIDTNGRYNLAADDRSFDVTQLEDGVPIARFLIIDEDAAVSDIESDLEDAGIEMLKPSGMVDGKVFYGIQIGAKLLANERFFPDRASTETYVSDEELCGVLGSLWKGIYAATGRLPKETPMRHTGMLEFSDHQTRLFPIPPYDWTDFDQPDVAKDHFLGTMGEELLLPSSPAGDYGRLIDAANRAWEER
jgi:hypothetical protein